MPFAHRSFRQGRRRHRHVLGVHARRSAHGQNSDWHTPILHVHGEVFDIGRGLFALLGQGTRADYVRRRHHLRSRAIIGRRRRTGILIHRVLVFVVVGVLLVLVWFRCGLFLL